MMDDRELENRPPDKNTDDEKDYSKVGLPPEGISLIIGPDDSIIDNADVRVRWCITPELTQYLQRKEVTDPHILLVTYNDQGKNEWRGMFPLTEIMAFARFYNAGDINIAAYIIDIEQPHEKAAWLDKDYGEFNNVMQVSGKPYKTRGEFGILSDAHEVVSIPDGVFTKEHPEWVEWFVNMWHGNAKYDDGCEFRYRAILAFSIKWIPMAAIAIFSWTIMLLITAFLYGVGLKSWIVNLKLLKNPLSSEIIDIVSSTAGDNHGDLRDSRFTFEIKWKPNVIQPVYSLLWLTPGVVIFMFVFLYSVQDSGPFIVNFYDAHLMTAYFIGTLTTLHILFDACVAFGNAIDIYGRSYSYRTTKEQFSEGVLFFICLAFITAMFILAPLWLTITVFSIIAIMIAVNVLILKRKFLSTVYNKYFKFLDGWIGYVLDRILGEAETYDNMQEIFCPDDLDNVSTDIKSLPPKRVSWKLHYRDIKSRFCKPRQRR